MLILMLAALAAAPQPSGPAATPDAPAAATAPAAPATGRDQVVCKTVVWEGIGTPQRTCATRAQWDERSAQERQALTQFQLRSYSANR